MRRLLATASTAALISCGAFSSDTPPAGTNPADLPPQTPDQNATPPVDGEPIIGVFVAHAGPPDADGSSVKPFHDLKAGIARAGELKQKVIVCAETFTESVELVDGVSIYGSYDCTDLSSWKVAADKRATVNAPSSPALHAEGITTSTRIDGFVINAPNIGVPSNDDKLASSVGAEIRNSKGVVFSKSLIHGGDGAPGVDGVEPAANGDTGTKSGVASVREQELACPGPNCGQIAGSAGGTSVCATGTSGGVGGQGGNGEWFVGGIGGAIVTPDPRGKPYTATATTSLGSTTEKGQGATGGDAADGLEGASGVSSLADDGFHPGLGGLGGNGSAAQGGGGGGGTESYWLNSAPISPASGNYRTATGAGGGAGGCGGLASTIPAHGGGASIGVFVVASDVAFESVAVTAGNGGRGGKGTLGSNGNGGGPGGAPTTDGINLVGYVGGRGGDGGHGGWGGFGGHGPPGPSIALVWSGTRPKTDAPSTLTPGQPGVSPGPLNKTTRFGIKSLPDATASAAPETEIKVH